jgi:hypothetical protein
LYLKQNKAVRIGITTALATTIGYFAGGLSLGGALTYGGFRAMRGVASLGGSAGGAFVAEKKVVSIEDLNKMEEEEKSKIFGDDSLSLEEKTKKNERSCRGL